MANRAFYDFVSSRLSDPRLATTEELHEGKVLFFLNSGQLYCGSGNCSNCYLKPVEQFTTVSACKQANDWSYDEFVNLYPEHFI